MKTLLQKILPFFLMGYLLLIPCVTRGQLVERIVALVNNEVITLSELEEAGKRTFEQLQQTTLPSEKEEKMKKARKDILDQLIEDKLLEQELKRKKVEVSDKEVDAAIQEILDQHRLKENDLKMALAKEGISYSQYRRNIRDSIGKANLVNREIKSKIVIKDEDVRKTYKEKTQEFSEPLEVKVQQIFFSTPPDVPQERITGIRQEAQAILEKARKGEDFAQLAKNFSQGPEAREGGNLGFFKHKELRPELEEVAFKLQVGEVSDLVQTKEGIHILRVMERKGGEPKPFAEVQNRIRNEMIQAEAEKQFQEWMKSLRSKAYIEVKL